MSRRARHAPRRTCVGCRAVRERSSLILIRADAAGGLVVEPRGGPGRGAYVCPRPDCLRRAWERKALPRALRRDLAGVDRATVERQFEAAARRRWSADQGHAGGERSPAPEGQ